MLLFFEKKKNLEKICHLKKFRDQAKAQGKKIQLNLLKPIFYESFIEGNSLNSWRRKHIDGKQFFKKRGENIGTALHCWVSSFLCSTFVILLLEVTGKPKWVLTNCPIFPVMGGSPLSYNSGYALSD